MIFLDKFIVIVRRLYTFYITAAKGGLSSAWRWCIARQKLPNFKYSDAESQNRHTVPHGVVVFPHIAGYAGREGTGTLLIVCTAVSGDGVFGVCLAMITDMAAI